MVIRSFLKKDSTQPENQSLPHLNQIMIVNLGNMLVDIRKMKSEISNKISDLESKHNSNDQKTGSFVGLLEQLANYKNGVEIVIAQTEKELQESNNFRETFQKLNKAESDEMQIENSKTKKEENKTILLENKKSKMEFDKFVSCNNVSDCRRFLFDPDYTEEYTDIKKSIKAVPIDNGGVLVGKMAFTGSMTDISATFKRASMTEIVRLSPRLQPLLLDNIAFKQYPIGESKVSRLSLPSLRDPTHIIDTWRILKENIGRNLSGLTLPVYLREPISLNQKVAEIFEYAPLLRKANCASDKSKTLAFISSFFILSIGQNKSRLKAAFNGLLSETYELIVGDLRILTETVCLNPQIVAFHADCKDFQANGEFQLQTRISVGGLEFEPLGTFRITLKSTGESYLVNRPIFTVNNYIFGEMYVCVKGELLVYCETETKSRAVIKFKPKGWSSKHDCEFTGEIFESGNTVSAKLIGKWDDKVEMFHENDKCFEIAKLNELPALADFQYSFSTFVINLNHTSYDLLYQLPDTDSRLRPDIRAHENGNIELASFENYRLEENQSSSIDRKPHWFEVSEKNGVYSTKYKHQYFECRQKMNWPDNLPNLYGEQDTV